MCAWSSTLFTSLSSSRTTSSLSKTSKVYKSKDCGCVELKKDVTVENAGTEVLISLQSEDTKIGEVINKPADYWYEVEVNPETAPQTIIGYDEEGAKVFRLYPEGSDK